MEKGLSSHARESCHPTFGWDSQLTVSVYDTLPVVILKSFLTLLHTILGSPGISPGVAYAVWGA